jgi:hypothetical protein
MEKINLRILTDDGNNDALCKLYWEVTDDLKFAYTVTELEKTFEIKKKELLQVVNANSIAESTEIFCEVCETPYEFQSRADFQERQKYLKYDWYSKEWLCEDCLLEREELKEQERVNKLEQYRKLIKESYSSEPNIIEITNISLEEAVYLLSFCRLCADEDFATAKSLGSMSFHERLSPDSNLDYEILRQLYRKNIIRVSSESPINAFSGDEADTFYLDKVFWLLPVSENSGKPKDLFIKLEEIFKSGNLPAHWLDERLNLWRKIALHECLEYLTKSLEEHSLNLNPGEKTIFVVNSLLEDYSVGQIYNLIWRAVRDAAAFMVRKGTSKQHAANTVVGAMQRYGETARIYTCPQTMISQVFFDLVLKIGESGFYRVPQIHDMSDDSIIDESDEIQ